MNITHAQPTQTFDRSAPIYDAIYAARGKSYRVEAAKLRALVEDRGIPDGSRWLDVACGTGAHLRFLASHYDVTGLDASLAMLRVAKRKLPAVAFHRQDMACFDLNASFDVISCLFSAIGYLPDEDALVAAIHRMADHLRPGGVLLIEPGLHPDNVAPAVTSRMSLDVVVEGRPGSITRTTSAVRGSSVLRIRFDYTLTLSESPGSTIEFVEYHPILLVRRNVYTRALKSAGLGVEYLEPGNTGHGMYLASKPRTDLQRRCLTKAPFDVSLVATCESEAPSEPPALEPYGAFFGCEFLEFNSSGVDPADLATVAADRPFVA